IIWNASNKWTRVPYGAVYAMANNGTLTGPTITGAVQLGLAGGDTLLPVSMFAAYTYCVYWVDAAGNICAGIRNDGTLETADITTAHILATSLNATAGIVGDL